MKIQHIIGEHGAMPQLCKGGLCPTAIVTEDGHVFVQGYELTDTERAALSAPAGEGYVRMPLAVLRKLAAHVSAL